MQNIGIGYRKLKMKSIRIGQKFCYWP